MENTSSVSPANDETISSITLVPSCGTTSADNSNDCPAADADPGVFQLSSTGIGGQGGSCPGTVFTIAVVDASTGKVSFTPPAPGTVFIPASGDASGTCTILFTFTVLKEPTKDSSGTAGLQTGTIANASGQPNGIGTTGSWTSTVSKASPQLDGTAPASSTVGDPIADSVTLSGGGSPTGGITFNVYGPADPTCAGTPEFSSLVQVSGNGVYPSTDFTPDSVGTYRWSAAYGGDTNNNSEAVACGANPSTNVIKASPAITNQASASVPLGDAISDTATFSGGDGPTGGVTFNVYGPDDASCSGQPELSTDQQVDGDGGYASGPFTPTVAGTYRWTSDYAGDDDNNAVPAVCTAAGDSVVVTNPPPQLALILSHPKVTYAGEQGELLSVVASATQAGPTPTGTVSFKESTTTLCTITLHAGAGSCRMSKKALNAGKYDVVAHYGGDAAYIAAASAAKTLTVAKANAKVKLTLSRSKVTAGHEQKERLSVIVSATTSGAIPTGKVTIKESNKTLCRITLSKGNGSCLLSKNKLKTGKYKVVADYAGDRNHQSARSTKRSLAVKR